MAKKILDLIIKVHDKATKDIAKIEGSKGVGGIKGLTKSLGGMINPATMAAGAVTAVGAAAFKAFSDFQSYTREVADFAAMIGATTEEASVFIKMSDDFNVTMDTMLASFRSMAKSGLQPTIEGMEELRLQYLAIKDPAEALFWIQGKIGEQGIKQILPMWEQIDGSLIDYADSMDEGLIVTKEMQENMEEIEVVLRDVKAGFKGLSLSVGGDIASIIVAVKTLGRETGHTGENMIYVLRKAIPVIDKFAAAWEATVAWAEESGEAIKEALTATEIYTPMMIARMRELGFAVKDVGDLTKELAAHLYYEQAAEAIVAGDYAAAQHFLDLANEAKEAEDRIRGVIQALIDGDGTIMEGWVTIHGIEQLGIIGSQIALGDGPTTVPSGGGGYGNIRGVADPGDPNWQEWLAYWASGDKLPRPKTYQFGGQFTVPGFGGTDSELVSFRASPGEQVTVGEDSGKDMIAEIRQMRLGLDKLGRILPVTIRDAIERMS